MRIRTYNSFLTSYSRNLIYEMNPLISIVDDDESVRTALKSLIDSVGFRAEVFGSGEEFLKSPYVAQTDCLIADVRM